MEEAKALPWGAVWDHFCLTENVPAGGRWLDEVKGYERNTLSRRK